MGGALMSFLPTSNRSGCLAGIYLVNAVVAPLAVFYNVRPRLYQGRVWTGRANTVLTSVDCRQLWWCDQTRICGRRGERILLDR